MVVEAVHLAKVVHPLREGDIVGLCAINMEVNDKMELET